MTFSKTIWCSVIDVNIIRNRLQLDFKFKVRFCNFQASLRQFGLDVQLELESSAGTSFPAISCSSHLPSTKCETLGSCCWRHLSVFLGIVTEVLLNDLVGKLVDLNILVVLQAFNLIQPSALLNHSRHRLNIGSSQFQHVVQSVQDHLDHLRVLAVQKVAKGWNDSLGHKVGNLSLVARYCEVADRPRRLLLSLEFPP